MSIPIYPTSNFVCGHIKIKVSTTNNVLIHENWATVMIVFVNHLDMFAFALGSPRLEYMYRKCQV